MAASTFSPATPSQLCSSKNGVFSSVQVLMSKPTRLNLLGKKKGMRITCQATSIPADDRVPDMGKRQLMNLLLLCAVSPHSWNVDSLCCLLCPTWNWSCRGGTVAKDALGNDVIAAEWLKTHGPGDRTLTQA